MAQTIDAALLELAASMGINVPADMKEGELRRRILNSTVMPAWLVERAQAEGHTIRDSITYETARLRLGEFITRKRGYRAGMVVMIGGVPTKIVGVRYGGEIVMGAAREDPDGWVLTGNATPVYVTALDDATVIYNPVIF